MADKCFKNVIVYTIYGKILYTQHCVNNMHCGKTFSIPSE